MKGLSENVSLLLAINPSHKKCWKGNLPNLAQCYVHAIYAGRKNSLAGHFQRAHLAKVQNNGGLYRPKSLMRVMQQLQIWDCCQLASSTEAPWQGNTTKEHACKGTFPCQRGFNGSQDRRCQLGHDHSSLRMVVAVLAIRSQVARTCRSCTCVSGTLRSGTSKGLDLVLP